MFKKQIIDYEVVINPIDLNKNIDNVILKQANDYLVDKCSGYGFIKQIFKITKKSSGNIVNDGCVIYNCFLEVLVCNPVISEEIDCEITDYDSRIGKCMMKKDPLLVILFPKNNSTLKVGDKVKGVITDKRIDKTNNIINLLVDVI